MSTKQILFVLFFSWISIVGTAQTIFNNWLQKLETAKIQPTLAAQIWGSYTNGAKVFNTATGQYEAADDRFNLMVRRIRFGFKSQPYENLQFVLVGAIDFVGRDALAGTVGGSNNGGAPTFGVWHTYVQWRIKKGSEAWNLTAGYLSPQLGRESLTSALAVNSFEKAFSQNYMRRHLVGTGPGRAAGVNLGGLILAESQKFGFNYNVGIFNPVFHAYGGNSTGIKDAPLLVGRGVIYFGDPEMEKYKLGGKINYYNQRRGLSVGFGGAYQEETDLFKSNTAAGVDFLLNLGALNFDGEWMWMWREGTRLLESGANRDFTYASGVGHLRIGYNIILKEKFFLEPSFMIMQFNGGTNIIEQLDASAVRFSSGTHRTYDLGINWHLNQKNLQLALHYVWRSGDIGEIGEGAAINLLYGQSEVGAIRRGDYLGLGIIAIF